MTYDKMTDVASGNRRMTRGTKTLIATLIVILGLCLGVTMMKNMDADVKGPVESDRVYRLSRLVDGCPDAKPMLARALADDRIDAREADAIEEEGRRLWRISTDATFHNEARRSAGLAKNPEPARCSLPYGVAN